MKPPKIESLDKIEPNLNLDFEKAPSPPDDKEDLEKPSQRIPELKIPPLQPILKESPVQKPKKKIILKKKP